jgi:hypothetical protein
MITRFMFVARWTIVLLVAFSLPGCCLISGCFVLHGEAYEALAHPKPMRDYWESGAASAEQRKLDWTACGGDEAGWVTPSVAEFDAERRAGEKDRLPARDRIVNRIHLCMIKSGYRYSGSCDSDFMKQKIECQIGRSR